MSTFLKPEAFLFIAGTTQGTIQTTIDGKLTAQGWQRITLDTVNFISDFIPPVTETTGDGRYRQVARIYYNTADISISMYDYPIVNSQAQMYRLTPGVAGAVAAGVTINGVLVTGAVGSAGSTAKDNLYALWVALMQSVDANITNWQFTYMPGVAGVDSILMERKTISGTLITITPNANVIGAVQGDPVLAGTPTAHSLAAALVGIFTLTIDRTNSFYVYMGIFSRSFHIGIKTTSNYYGWGFCYWMPNADALAAIPTKANFLINSQCRIQEGFYGLVNGSAAAPTGTYNVRTPVAFGMTYAWNYVPSNITSMGTTYNFNAAGGGAVPGYLVSFTVNGHWSNQTDTFTAYVIDTPTANYPGVIDLANVAIAPTPFVPATIGGNPPYVQASSPAVYLEDVFAASSANTDSNEVTVIAGIAQPSNITLQQNLDDTTAYTTVLLNTVTGLATVGTNYIVLNQEVFSYTGTSGGNTLTGVTRAYNATPQKRHFIGDQALQGGWFVKMNGGFAFMGLTRPVAA